MIRFTACLVLFFTFALRNGNSETFTLSGPTYNEADLDNFQSSMTVSYTVSDYNEIFPSNVVVTLFPRDCPNGESLDQTTEVVQIDETTYDGSTTFEYDITVESSLIDDSSDLVTFVVDDEAPYSIGAINFCTRVTTFLDSVGSNAISASFTNWVIGFNMTGGIISFEDELSVSTSTIEDEEFDVVTPGSVSICYCEDITCKTPGAIEMNSNIELCLSRPSRFDIPNFNLVLTVGNFEYTPITLGTDGEYNIVSSDLTSVTTNNRFLVITTFAVGSLYEQDSTTLEVSGTAVLEFESSTRTEELSTFRTLLVLKKGEGCFEKVKKKFRSLWY